MKLNSIEIKIQISNKGYISRSDDLKIVLMQPTCSCSAQNLSVKPSPIGALKTGLFLLEYFAVKNFLSVFCIQMILFPRDAEFFELLENIQYRWKTTNTEKQILRRDDIP